DRFTGEIRNVPDAGDVRDPGRRAGRDDDVPGRERPAVHLDGIRSRDTPESPDAFHPEPGVTLDGVVRLDGPDDVLNPFHDPGEVEPDLSALEAEFPGAPGVRKDLGAPKESFARNAA